MFTKTEKKAADRIISSIHGADAETQTLLLLLIKLSLMESATPLYADINPEFVTA